MSADAPAPREPPEISTTGVIGPTGSTIAIDPARSTIAIGPTGATGTTQLDLIVGSTVELGAIDPAEAGRQRGIAITALFRDVAETREPSAWPSLEKCQVLASLIIGLRPDRVVEIGVWRGCSIIPQLLALRCLGAGQGVAIDPWSADASIAGQTDEANIAWWGQQQAHDEALEVFRSRLIHLELASVCRIIRLRSDDVDLDALGDFSMLHIDGNHADQAVRDVDRYARRLPVGGVLVMDDLGWTDGHVQRAYELAKEIGFVDRYPLGTGCVLTRARV
jgi:predicted O-methyltransferase YrrM